MKNPSLVSILPFIIFILLFIGCGIYFQDFYALPSPVAVLIGITFAFIVFKGNFNDKINTFIEGCGDKNILNMCLIYLLAGAFSTISKSIGCIDAIVYTGSHLVSSQYIPVGIFIMAAFISLASGTSVGTIVTLGPIALGFSNASNIEIIGGALLGGAMFGDNLSMISDTTIAATQSQHCDMKDKFKTNLWFALPAAIITSVLFIIVGQNQESGAINTENLPQNNHLILIIPYLIVILLSLLGANVFLVLVLGIISCGILGFSFYHLDFLTFSKKLYEGFTGMQDIFLLSLLTGGLAALVEKAGGIDFILNLLQNKIKGKKSALLGIGGLVGIIDMATANNTISIIICGKIAKNISDQYKIAGKYMASILDTFSCIIQGLLPYGAQVLILIGMSNSKISYQKLIEYTFYPIILLICVIVWVFTLKHKKANS